MTAAELKPHVLSFLRGSPASTIRDIAIALDIHNEMGDLRACMDGLRRHKKVAQERDDKGITRYRLPESPESPATQGASAKPVATAAEEAAPEPTPSTPPASAKGSPSKSPRAARAAVLKTDSPAPELPVDVPPSIEGSGNPAQEIHSGEVHLYVPVVTHKVAPEPVPSKPAVGSRIPFGLLDRIEAISTDIEDALGDAFDIDVVPMHALKSLAAASGAIHRALRAFYTDAGATA